MSPVPPARVRALSIHAQYRCRSSGACCSSGWRIPVEPASEQRIRQALATGLLPTTVSAPGPCLWPAPGLPHGARSVLATDAAGRCVFFDHASSRLCAVRREVGEEAMPSACRQFPRVAVLTPLGVSVTLSHYCPTAAALLFEPSRPGVVEHPRAFPASWPWEGLDARGALPPLLRPGVLMSWPAHERWEEHAVAALTDAARTAEEAIATLVAQAEVARRWTPRDREFEPFFAGVLARPPLPAGDDRPRWTPQQAWRLVASTIPGSHPRPRPPEAAGNAEAARLVGSGWSALRGPIGAWLAARAFASWLALQGTGLRTSVLGLEVALGVLRAEAGQGCAEAGRPLDAELLKAAVRRADLLLVHLADPQALASALGPCERQAPASVLGSDVPRT